MQLLLLFDLGPVVLLAGAKVFTGRQPQLEVDPSLDGGALRPAAQFVPALDTRRRDLLIHLKRKTNCFSFIIITSVRTTTNNDTIR